MKTVRNNEKTVKSWMKWRPAIVPSLALIGVGVLPDMLKDLYEPYSSELVSVHVPLFVLFISVIIVALSVKALSDLSSRRTRAFKGAAFSWRPGESYLAGRSGEQGEGQTEE